MVKETLTWQNCTSFVSNHRSVYIQFFKFCQSCQQNVQMSYCKGKVKHSCSCGIEPLMKVWDTLQKAL